MWLAPRPVLTRRQLAGFQVSTEVYRRYAIADARMLREGGDMPLEGVTVAELSEGIAREMVGWDGIEPPTPRFSVGPGEEDHASPSSDIVDEPRG